MIARQDGRMLAAFGELTAAIASSEDRQREALDELAERITVRREGQELADMSAELKAANDLADATAASLKLERRRRTKVTARLGAAAGGAGTLAAIFFAAFLDRSCASREVATRVDQAIAAEPLAVPIPVPVPSPDLATTNARVDSLERKLDQILERLPQAKAK